MSEMTRLHDEVARRVACRVGGWVERTKTYTPGAGRHGGPGYPDVIIKSGNMVWEVKPKTVYGLRSGPKQMGRYINGGRIPGYPVIIEPFEYTLGGKKGKVYVTNGLTPADRGVVYYEFREYEESREPVHESESVPSTVPSSSYDRIEERETSINWGGVILLGCVSILALLSPIPGDEEVAIAAFAAALA